MAGNPKIKKCQDKIKRLTGKALVEYKMIAEGDKVLVACSGGKDSTALLLILNEILKSSPVKFSLYPVMVDQKQPGFDPQEFKGWLKCLGFDLHIIEENTYSIITNSNDENKKHCSLCARLRRGILYTFAAENGFSKIALGHHREDINETLLLNLFFEGAIATMPPVLISNDKRNTVIRPFCNVSEENILYYSQLLTFPTVDCGTCKVNENKQRREIKNLLAELTKKHPDINASILAATKNVKYSHLLDTKLSNY